MIEHDQQVPHKRQEQRRARAVRHDVLVSQNAADGADEVRAERRGLGAAPLLAELPPVARQAAPPPPPHLALGVLDARLEHFFPWPLQSVLLSTRRWRCGSSADAGCALAWGRCTQGERCCSRNQPCVSCASIACGASANLLA